MIRPDGVTKRTEQHRVDLSACDEVTIKVPLRDAQINGGEFILYAWKKYGYNVTIECTMDVRR